MIGIRLLPTGLGLLFGGIRLSFRGKRLRLSGNLLLLSETFFPFGEIAGSLNEMALPGYGDRLPISGKCFAHEIIMEREHNTVMTR
ncbi:hypothetical protein [Ochrobactrum sp. AN78]|uniref:hypothetical protein n=1 Tax=Ochrobactrum sp. AN78 TaxID=3039853 RepID=UPI00298A0332|nr:hypothetical protein [Ochrobactrum sp. AN78]MDH7793409.1 hypothetical protein [Ochrobactrum sp. AN78]